MDDDKFEVPARLRLLQQALTQPLAFRAESGSRPLVYGYVRAAANHPRYVDACRQALDRYCSREKLTLCSVFTDHGIPAEDMCRPGLAGLCQARWLPDSFAAVMVWSAHLSTDGRIAQLLAEQVRKTGARLLFAYPRIPGSGATMAVQQWWQ